MSFKRWTYIEIRTTEIISNKSYFFSEICDRHEILDFKKYYVIFIYFSSSTFWKKDCISP